MTNNNTSAFYVQRIDYHNGDASDQRNIEPETLTITGTKDSATYQLVIVLDSKQGKVEPDSEALQNLTPISKYDPLIKNIVVDENKLQSDQDSQEIKRLINIIKEYDLPLAVQKTSNDIRVLGIEKIDEKHTTFAVDGQVTYGISPVDISHITICESGIEIRKRDEGQYALQQRISPEATKQILKEARFVPDTPDNTKNTKELQKIVTTFLKNSESR